MLGDYEFSKSIQNLILKRGGVGTGASPPTGGLSHFVPWSPARKPEVHSFLPVDTGPIYRVDRSCFALKRAKSCRKSSTPFQAISAETKQKPANVR